MNSPFKSPFKITQYFGVNKEYYDDFGLAGHEGIDLIPQDLNDWTIISPFGDGVVVKDIDDPKQGGAYGNTVTVWYAKKKIALQFCHMSENYVRIDDKISKGQNLGKMGATGNTQGAHLHLNRFEVDENGYRQNKENGFLGGTDPLPMLTEGDSEPMVTLAQSEVDEMRRLRDSRYNFISQLCQAVGISYDEDLIKLLEGTKKKFEDLKVEASDANTHKKEAEQSLEVANETIRQKDIQLKDKDKTYQLQISDLQKQNEELRKQNPDVKKLMDDYEVRLKNLNNALKIVTDKNTQLTQENTKLKKPLPKTFSEKLKWLLS